MSWRTNVAWSLAVATSLTACERRPAAAAPVKPVAVARGRVEVDGGLVRIAAQRDGVVREVLVTEGQRVSRGEPLARLEDGQPRLAAAVARREVEERRAALLAGTVRVEGAAREERRAETLVRSGAITAREHAETRDRAELGRREQETLRAALRTAEARLALAEDDVRKTEVRAPCDGVVLRRLVRPGDGVSTLMVTPLFLFAPDLPRVVRADVDERFLDGLRPGAPAWVSSEVDPAAEVPAQVVRVSDLVGTRPASDDPSERLDVRSAEVVLALDAPRLRLGQRVLVRFEARERRERAAR